MVLAIFAPFSQIGAMVLVLSPKRIKLGSCACTHIKALEVGMGRFTQMMMGICQKREKRGKPDQ